jgi:hypothetical protein
MLGSVRIMASRASLLEGWLMEDFLVLLLGLIHDNSGNIDAIRLRKRARLAGVGFGNRCNRLELRDAESHP